MVLIINKKTTRGGPTVVGAKKKRKYGSYMAIKIAEEKMGKEKKMATRSWNVRHAYFQKKMSIYIYNKKKRGKKFLGVMNDGFLIW